MISLRCYAHNHKFQITQVDKCVDLNDEQKLEASLPFEFPNVVRTELIFIKQWWPVVSYKTFMLTTYTTDSGNIVVVRSRNPEPECPSKFEPLGYGSWISRDSNDKYYLSPNSEAWTDTWMFAEDNLMGYVTANNIYDAPKAFKAVSLPAGVQMPADSDGDGITDSVEIEGTLTEPSQIELLLLITDSGGVQYVKRVVPEVLGTYVTGEVYVSESEDEYRVVALVLLNNTVVDEKRER